VYVHNIWNAWTFRYARPVRRSYVTVRPSASPIPPMSDVPRFRSIARRGRAHRSAAGRVQRRPPPPQLWNWGHPRIPVASASPGRC